MAVGFVPLGEIIVGLFLGPCAPGSAWEMQLRKAPMSCYGADFPPLGARELLMRF